MAEKISIQVFRFNPQVDKEGRLEKYSLEKEEGMRILGALKALNNQGHNIAFRYSCEEWECGSCAIRANGTPVLACKTEVMDGMVLEPLPDLPVKRDLIVDRSKNFKKQAELYMLPTIKSGAELTYEAQEQMWKSIVCMECDVCLASCPILHTRGGSYKYSGPEFMVQLFRSEMDTRIDKKSLEISVKEGIWECTTCNHCVQNCPQRIKIKDLIVDLRRFIIERQSTQVPATIRDLNKNLSKHHNPYGKPKTKRIEWAEGIALRLVKEMKGSEWLWIVGCEQCFNTRDQVVARSMVEVFDKAKVEFVVLGNEEVNVGDPAFMTGEIGLFEELVEINLSIFKKYGIKKIITTSPHDFNILKNEYPKYGGNFEVIHYTQLLENLIRDKKLNFTRNLTKTVTFHDPCFLGRYNSVYDSPRNVLQAIPGIKLVEMPSNRDQAECCGGGGGGNWLDIPAGERLADRRVRQAVQTGSDILVVACPFCLAMFEDAVKTQGYEGKLEVKQLIELVSEAV